MGNKRARETENKKQKKQRSKKPRKNAVTQLEKKELAQMDFEYDSDDSNVDKLGTVVDINWEGFTPIEEDTDGIYMLVKQSFLGLKDTTVDDKDTAWRSLANLIVDQNYLGSVIKQVLDEEEAIEDEEDELEGLEDVESDFVHGVTTIINLTKPKDNDTAAILDNIRSQLLEKCSSSTISEKDKKIFENSLKADSTKHTGLLINERLYNHPMDLSIPALKSLVNEVEAAKQIQLDVTFKKVILISKVLKMTSKKKKGAAPAVTNEYYENEEDETLVKRSLATFEYSVQSEAGQKKGVQRCRRVMIFDYGACVEALQTL